MPAELTEEIDFLKVVRSELRSHNRFLPPSYVDTALLGHEEEIASWLGSLMKRHIVPVGMDTVMARKSGAGSRPLPYMSLQDRLVYRALVSTIESRLPETPRGEGAYQEFVTAPIVVDDCRYVLKTDVAAFYQYIDHERLIDEVVAQTGDDLAVTAALELLQEASGRRFGLPQMNEASDALADVYIEPVRRALVRGQHAVVRYADDFRVACTDYNEALAALEVTERSAHQLGLVLNEAKTMTPHIDTYVASLGAVEDAEQRLFGLLPEPTGLDDVESFFIPAVEPYGGAPEDDELPTLGEAGHGIADDEIDPPDDDEAPREPTARQIEAARLVISLWSDEDRVHEVNMEWTRATRSALLRKAMTIQAQTADTQALEHVTALLVQEPHLTPQICGYLESVAIENPREVYAVLDAICERRIVSVWQAVWLSHFAGALPRPRRNTASSHISWLQAQLQSEHPAVAAEASLALARRRRLSPDAAAESYNRLPQVHRPTGLLALAVATERGDAGLLADDQIGRWQAEWARDEWGRQRPSALRDTL